MEPITVIGANFGMIYKVDLERRWVRFSKRRTINAEMMDLRTERGSAVFISEDGRSAQLRVIRNGRKRSLAIKVRGARRIRAAEKALKEVA